MIVINLFNGISCGRVALERAKIPVTKYYSSEVDKYAIQITNKNYPDTIELGDITNWREWDIVWEDVDLLLAGFSCQSWSVAGNQKGRDDSRGELAYVLVDILNHLRKVNDKFKFLFENVKMKNEFRKELDNMFECESVLINSALVSAQNRMRYYWVGNEEISQPEDKKILLKDIIETNGIPVCFSSSSRKHKELIERRMSCNDKAHTLTKTGYSNRSFSGVIDGFEIRKFTSIEKERLQTLDDNYTEGFSDAVRQEVLGNGWTVDVIVHILKEIFYEKV